MSSNCLRLGSALLHPLEVGVDEASKMKRMDRSRKIDRPAPEAIVSEKRIVVESMGLSGYVMFGPVREPKPLAEKPPASNQVVEKKTP